jgi:hypothetical protein
MNKGDIYKMSNIELTFGVDDKRKNHFVGFISGKDKEEAQRKASDINRNYKVIGYGWEYNL